MRRVLLGAALGALTPACSDAGERVPADPAPPHPVHRSVLGDRDTFGSVDDVAFGGEVIAVVDVTNRTVHLFDTSGEAPAVRLAGQGQGPGEIGIPRAVEFTATGNLLVLDLGNARISEYALGEEGTTSVRDTPAPFPAQDLCLFGDRVFVSGLHDGHFLHELGDDGAILRSYLDPDFPHEMKERFTAAARLSCDAEEGVAFLKANLFPELYRVDLATGAHEVLTVSGFHGAVFEPDERGASMPTVSESGLLHVVVGFTRLDDDTLLMGVRETRVADGSERVLTMILDRTSAGIRAVWDSIAVLTVHDRQGVGITQAPVPEAAILEFGGE